MKAYSLDLRERVVAAIHQGHPVSVIARVFSVSRATAQRWVRREAAGKPLGPRPRPGAARRIGPSAEPALEAQLRAHPAALLAEHCRLWDRVLHAPNLPDCDQLPALHCLDHRTWAVGPSSETNPT